MPTPPSAPSLLPTLLVGCGRIARRHLAALDACGEAFSLCGVVEPAPCDGEAPWDRLTAPRFATLEQALEATAPSLVVLCSPSGEHARQAEQALEAGAHVLCEKPVALCDAELARLEQLATTSQRLIFPCYQTRHSPLLRRVAEALTRGALGEVHTLEARLFWARPQRYFDEAPWRGTLAHDGGILFNQANHLLESVLALLGEPEWVFAEQAALQRRIEAPDSAALLMRWPGTIGSLSATVLCEPHNLECSLTLLGSRGAIKLGGMACERLVWWEVPELPLDEQARLALEAHTAEQLALGHLPLYRELLALLADAASAQAAPSHTLAPARRTARLLDAALRAQREQRPVSPLGGSR